MKTIKLENKSVCYEYCLDENFNGKVTEYEEITFFSNNNEFIGHRVIFGDLKSEFNAIENYTNISSKMYDQKIAELCKVRIDITYILECDNAVFTFSDDDYRKTMALIDSVKVDEYAKKGFIKVKELNRKIEKTIKDKTFCEKKVSDNEGKKLMTDAELDEFIRIGNEGDDMDMRKYYVSSEDIRYYRKKIEKDIQEIARLEAEKAYISSLINDEKVITEKEITERITELHKKEEKNRSADSEMNTMIVIDPVTADLDAFTSVDPDSCIRSFRRDTRFLYCGRRTSDVLSICINEAISLLRSEGWTVIDNEESEGK